MAVSESLLSTLAALVHENPVVWFLAPLVLLVVRSLYRISPFHSLSSVPGPLLPRLTSAWLNYHAYIGDEARVVHELHKKHGAMVRNGPNSVDIDDGIALQAIYIDKGGFAKPAFYDHFDIDGHKTIFSQVDPAARNPRAKAVVPIFSLSKLRAGSETIDEVLTTFVDRLQREVHRAKSGGAPSRPRIDVLAICRALAIDVVTEYLFGMKYGACEEDLSRTDDTVPSDTMTASAMVDSFVGVGKFWYLPPLPFQLAARIDDFLWSDPLVEKSMNQVDAFVTKVVQRASEDTVEKTSSPSYPRRLLDAKFSESEVHAQCKDLVFAGTDSTAMNLATIILNLTNKPAVYEKLKLELTNSDPSYDALQLQPYLRGVVREGLRLALANPSRLPRVVPPSGWTFRDTYIPPGTIVSCTAYTLHFNPDVYPDPFTFNPDRWLPENNPTEEMNRDLIPFGLGSRQCIARNLATTELFCAVKRLVDSGVLEQLKGVHDRIEIKEWFNSHVIGGKVELGLRDD